MGRDVVDAFNRAVAANPELAGKAVRLFDLPLRTTVHTVQSRIAGARRALLEQMSGGPTGFRAMAKDRADLRWMVKAFGSLETVTDLVGCVTDPGACVAFELRALTERRNALMHFETRRLAKGQKLFAFIGTTEGKEGSHNGESLRECPAETVVGSGAGES